MYKIFIITLSLLSTLVTTTTPVFAQNIVKQAVHLNRDINKTKKQYKKQVKKAERKLDKVQANINTVKKGDYAENQLQKIEDKASHDLKKKKRKLVDDWLAE
ncbi:hypothetical protein [Shewanella pealeana]|uniref:Uncharacterized protein n=1 Tax=Shewanella pealeana (strain ATCC 700345 / ANG-SQ1) TaxID=398579 RepID=A8H329_SHEPA|nr:hypothetical protein [Shewanella pealeana]ABV86966.1 hypothetical protein Spea_1641 [Shewanella pealeana ATCC 700345]